MRDLQNSVSDLRNDMKTAQATQGIQIDSLEKTLTKKHTDLCKKLDITFQSYDSALDLNRAATAENTRKIDALIQVVETQRLTIAELSDRIDTNELKATNAIQEVLILANGIEAHQRRWAVRINGLPAPSEGEEETFQAKHVVLGFIESSLHIDNVFYEDIDCAHRVGRVVDNKQSMLARFHARDLVQLILKNKTKLKGTSVVVYEDSTYLNRQLLQVVKDHPKIDSGWISNGAVWGKTEPNGRKIKFTLGQDIDALLINKPVIPNKQTRQKARPVRPDA